MWHSVAVNQRGWGGGLFSWLLPRLLILNSICCAAAVRAATPRAIFLRVWLLDAAETCSCRRNEKRKSSRSLLWRLKTKKAGLAFYLCGSLTEQTCRRGALLVPPRFSFLFWTLLMSVCLFLPLGGSSVRLFFILCPPPLLPLPASLSIVSSFSSSTLHGGHEFSSCYCS